MVLNQKIYEIIRWCIAIVIPAVNVLIVTLSDAWGWNIPADEIVTSLSAVALFLGTIFGISKLSYDKEQAETAAKVKKKAA